MDKVAQNIIEARERAGLNQSELARAVGVSPQAVQKWEKGETHPRGKTASKVAEVLGISVLDLIGLAITESDSGYIKKSSDKKRLILDDFELLRRVIDRLKHEEIQCRRVDPDQDHDIAFKLKEKKYYADLVCNIDGTTILVEVKSAGYINPELLDIANRPDSPLIFATKTNIEDLPKQIKARARQLNDSIQAALNHFRKEYSPEQIEKREKIASDILSSINKMSEDDLQEFVDLINVIRKNT